MRAVSAHVTHIPETYVRCKIAPGGQPPEGSWFVTHGIGSPAADMYSTVEIPTDLGVPEWNLEIVVAKAATEVYRDRFAFVYPPDRRPSEDTHREHIVVISYQRY
jgi:hypothetical protein